MVLANAHSASMLSNVESLIDAVFALEMSAVDELLGHELCGVGVTVPVTHGTCGVFPCPLFGSFLNCKEKAKPNRKNTTSKPRTKQQTVNLQSYAIKTYENEQGHH